MTRKDYEVVTILAVRPFGLFDTVTTFDGIDVSGLKVVVAIDHRPARLVREALLQGSEPECQVEDWQVIGRYSPEFIDSQPRWVLQAQRRRNDASMAEREADRAAGRDS